MATKIDVLSGFLGAGKTTLIKKLLAEALEGENLVLIENEFGEISVDGGFLGPGVRTVLGLYLLHVGGGLYRGFEAGL